MADNVSSRKEKFATAIGKFSGSRFVRSIMAAGYSVIPFSIIGAIFLILEVLPQAIPIPGFAAWYAGTIGRFDSIFGVVYNSTMGILALIFSGTFTYKYVEIYRNEEHLALDPLNGLMMFLMAMFITVPQLVWKSGMVQPVQSVTNNNFIIGGYAISGAGVTRIAAVGIFTGLVVGWITVQIYRLTIKHDWRIKMPESVPSGVSNSFSALIPGFCVAVTISLINLILVLAGTDIFRILYIPFSFISGIVDTWWGFMIMIFLTNLLWWFGIHGATIIGSLATPIALANLAANVAGASHFYAGDPSNAFVSIGGSGATLGVAIWLAFRSRSKQLNEIGKVELVPSLFNINEPLLFGLPIVYNVDLAIPFIFAPMASGLLAYVAIATHIVPKIRVQQPWPTTVGIGGFLATASWKGAVLAVLCALVAFIVWYPFIRRYDHKLLRQEQAAAAKILAEKK